MKTWLANIWGALSSGFWLVPGGMLVAGFALAILSPVADRHWGGLAPESFHTTAVTARATLTALSGAMFTVTGVVFSTTAVALSITSAQLGPRLLRNFLGKLVTQVTLGICLGASVYCLVLLRQIDKFEGEVFVPHFSLMLASLLGLLTLGAVVYFIHCVAFSMQAQNVASDIADDLDAAVHRLFPDHIGEAAGKASDRTDADDEAKRSEDQLWQERWDAFTDRDADTVRVDADGYLQAVNEEDLLEVARQQDVMIRLRMRPGDYVRRQQPLLEVAPAGRLDESDRKVLRKAFMLGNQRTTQQDVECAINELVEIALRALSPGVNDPFTAITCIDRLSSSLRSLATRRLPTGLRCDETGELRILVKPRRFDNIVDAAMNQIRQNSTGNVAVTARLLEAIHAIGEVAVRRADRAALARQAEMVIEAARSDGLTQFDLDDLEDRYRIAVRALQTDRETGYQDLYRSAAKDVAKSCVSV